MLMLMLMTTRHVDYPHPAMPHTRTLTLTTNHLICKVILGLKTRKWEKVQIVQGIFQIDNAHTNANPHTCALFYGMASYSQDRVTGTFDVW